MIISLFLAINLLLNSRPGRVMEELFADGIVQGWRRFGLPVITGAFWLVVDFFRGVLETIERLMYSVNEWLRFKTGERSVTLVAKAGLGLLWFFVSYVLRFAVNVLIEPQINPIKHFPVVTVSHKLLLPLYKPFADLLELSMGMTAFRAWLLATGTIWSIPGIFGFLVWELKENWRLYEANRRPNLAATPIGSHGETIRRLLRPGFHSGTIPKRFAKLRRAERRARTGANWSAVRKQWFAIRRVELALRRYVQREFLELLSESPSWQISAVVLERVRLATNRVELVITCPELEGDDLQISLEVESGWLIAGVTSTGWTDQLAPHQRQALATALVGLYKTAGIDLVRQQIEEQFAPVPQYDVVAGGLAVWPERDWNVEILYDLRGDAWVAPQSVRGLARQLLPTLARWRLVFDEVPIPWERWVSAWGDEIAGQVPPQEPIAPVSVLPPAP